MLQEPHSFCFQNELGFSINLTRKSRTVRPKGWPWEEARRPYVSISSSLSQIYYRDELCLSQNILIYATVTNDAKSQWPTSTKGYFLRGLRVHCRLAATIWNTALLTAEIEGGPWWTTPVILKLLPEIDAHHFVHLSLARAWHKTKADIKWVGKYNLPLGRGS